MKERPILFSGPMVRAILEGRKTQTRRIVKPQPYPWKMEIHRGELFVLDGGWRPFCRVPFGCPGDRLWVKETHRFTTKDDCAHYDACGCKIGLPIYAADCEAYRDENGPWNPSIFMPRKLSRLTLEIESVRVERLQEITEEDAIAEGVSESMPCGYLDNGTSSCSPRCKFKYLWQSINGPGSWDLNPWVWEIQFKHTPTAPSVSHGLDSN